MQTSRISPARKIILCLSAALGLAALPGCQTVTLTNLTPPAIDENPSQIYTFTLRVTPHTNTVVANSIDPHIVVDGKSYPLRKSGLGEGLYEFEYQLPPGREVVPYYFLVNYNIEGNGVLTPSEIYTDVQRAAIVRRKVLSLDANRGPVGARISVLGRGFTPSDVILIGGTAVRTSFESATSLSFFVPPLDPNRNYLVTLQSPAGNSPVGTFHIDSSTVSVTRHAARRHNRCTRERDHARSRGPAGSIEHHHHGRRWKARRRNSVSEGFWLRRSDYSSHRCC